MQGARHGFIKGREGGREALSYIVLLTLWFIILSCLGRCNKRPSHNILFNRSIVHAIRLHVSEVRFWKILKFMRYCILIFVLKSAVYVIQLLLYNCILLMKKNRLNV